MQKFSNEKLDIYERAVTIDGKSYHSQIVPLRGYVLPSKVERICSNICQSPDFVNANRVSIPTKPLNLRKTEVCASCHLKLDEGQCVTLKYEYIIKGFEYDHLYSNESNFVKQSTSPRQGNAENQTLEELIKNDIKFDRLRPMNLNMETYQIPGLIRKLHPNLTFREYKQLKLEPGFWKKEIIVCEECYLSVCKSIIESGSVDGVKDPKSKVQFFGTGPLRPQTISQSRENVLSRIEARRTKEEKKLAELEESKFRMTGSSKHFNTARSFQQQERTGSSSAFRLRKYQNSGPIGLSLTGETDSKGKRMLTEDMDNSMHSDDNRNTESDHGSQPSLVLNDTSKTQRSSQIPSQKELHLFANEDHKAARQKHFGDPNQNSYSQGGTLQATTNTSKSTRHSTKGKSRGLLSPINFPSKNSIQRPRARNDGYILTEESNAISSPLNHTLATKFEQNLAKSALNFMPKKHYLSLLANKAVDSSNNYESLRFATDFLDHAITPTGGDSKFASSIYSTQLYTQTQANYF